LAYNNIKSKPLLHMNFPLDSELSNARGPNLKSEGWNELFPLFLVVLNQNTKSRALMGKRGVAQKQESLAVACARGLKDQRGAWAKEQKGNMTPGIVPTTLDGMSLEKFAKLSHSLKNESFDFNPQIQIPKPTGGYRPSVASEMKGTFACCPLPFVYFCNCALARLPGAKKQGQPGKSKDRSSQTREEKVRIAPLLDRIVQEAMRIILNAIYDPTFSEDSHGFRPHKSRHTA
jgi:hypothetical protein